MRISVVIRSRDEAPRLRLTLASLEKQEGLHEVVVVDDGSVDDTAAILAEAGARLPLTALHNSRPEGRPAASNRGAESARGELLLFLDGDTLAGPGMIAAHRDAHRSGRDLIGRGETWHLRCTRTLQDPETGMPWPHEPEGPDPVAHDAARVTRIQVRDDFDAIARRAQPGIYPGAAARRLHALEMAALADAPKSPRLWAAASGSNLSVRREAFLSAGGFDPAIDLNEHRELAYRLCAAGSRMVPVRHARSYHLTHRAGWRDPLRDRAWEQRFRSRHPEAPLEQLTGFWRAIGTRAEADFFA